MPRRAICLLVATLLAGCGGWHLRGTGPGGSLDHTVFVSAAAANDVGRALVAQIVNRGGRVTATRNAADLIVDIDGERFERRTLSVDPDTGKVREVELALNTSFAVRTPRGVLLLPREELSWQLDYVFDEGAVLGTVEQDHIIQRDLAETAATAIALRLQ
ncbi:MAG: LPS assembly lipoprotein LptE, partial [Gammaproteobacteria bacterium]